MIRYARRFVNPSHSASPTRIRWTGEARSMAGNLITSSDGAPKGEHTLRLERRKYAAVTGVTDVCSYHDTEIVLKLDSGLMYLTGENLHISRLLLDEGSLNVDGQLDGVVYESPKKPMKRLFAWKRPRP